MLDLFILEWIPSTPVVFFLISSNCHAEWLRGFVLAWGKTKFKGKWGSISKRKHFLTKPCGGVTNRVSSETKQIPPSLISHSEGNLLHVTRDILISLPNYKALWITLKEKKKKKNFPTIKARTKTNWQSLPTLGCDKPTSWIETEWFQFSEPWVWRQMFKIEYLHIFHSVFSHRDRQSQKKKKKAIWLEFY